MVELKAFEISEPPSKVAYTVEEAAFLLSYSKTHLYQLRAEGKIRFIGAGRGTRVPREEINRLIREGIQRDIVETDQGKRQATFAPRVEKRQKTKAARASAAA